MNPEEQAQWREKVRCCACAIGLIPVGPAGDTGWYYKEYPNASLEYRYFPLTSGSQCFDLLVRFRLNVQWDGACARVYSGRGERGDWQKDLAKAVVDYVASHSELRPNIAVRKSTPTR